MNRTRTRREFLKLSILNLTAIAFRKTGLGILPDDFDTLPMGIARVTTKEISIFQTPGFSSPRTGRFSRDQIIILLQEITTSRGPSYNPRWYRTPEGYVHSAFIQKILPRFNPPTARIPPGGRLGELTIASRVSMLKTRNNDWYPRYQLYFGSLHWITGIETGPHPPQPWYQITDDLIRVKHYVPAQYVRLLTEDELQPISPHIFPGDKRIRVSLTDQTLTAYERGHPVFHTRVSTGLESNGDLPEDEIPTDTPTGRFRIGNKMPSRHMGEGDLTSSPEDYELLGVPWVSYFHETGAAFHGTYWHDNFGRRMSHGCVNLRTQDARWIYLWTTPTLAPTEWYRIENGTVVDIS